MEIEVRALGEDDVEDADRILRTAFGAFLNIDMNDDTDVIGTRFRASHTVALAAVVDGTLAGSALVTLWGSVGYLGPVSVTPSLWNSGVGSRLVQAATEVLDAGDATHQGLFTFPESPRHHWLYHKFGFWPRFLTVIMSRPVAGEAPELGWRMSAAPVDRREALLDACAAVTDPIMPGLDVRGEIMAVLDQGLGEVVLVGEPDAPRGFAVCHTGPGTEAGSGRVYVKFAAVRPGPHVADVFAALLAACHGFAAGVGARKLVLGVSTARHEVYRHLLATGFRVDTAGVTMHRPNVPGYAREDVYLLDDWR
ncbi:GNAT family N-acetyltransferase [Pseudonocardia xinjiangensis]|uniref:GNAT family N-acetyltransferase n=1 Tax=Pseudonocardia xinjiangensis TaxID=75289 RepID=UPI003D8ADAFC